jgi:osmotically-inducible protein OsmY
MTYAQRLSILTIALTLTIAAPALAVSAVDDSKVSADVVAQLNQQAAFKVEPRVIRVETINGKTYLYGIVSSGDERQLAGEIARKTPGVGTVVNTLSVDK